MKSFLGLKKVNVRELCILGLLTSLTVVLAIFCTIRIGDTIKIPLKFITVFLTAVFFGPVWGGTVGALGDILNAILVPVGAPIPMITAVEFLYGFIFGLFFYKSSEKYLLKTLLCSFILTLVDIFIVSFILTSVGYFPSLLIAISVRFTASIAKFIIYVLTLLFLKKYLNFIGGQIRRDR